MWIVESTCILNRVDKFIIFWFYTGLFAFPVENNFSEINKLSSMRKLPFQSTHFEKYISVTWQYFAFLSSLFIFSKWPIILYYLKFPKVYVYSKRIHWSGRLKTRPLFDSVSSDSWSSCTVIEGHLWIALTEKEMQLQALRTKLCSRISAIQLIELPS